MTQAYNLSQLANFVNSSGQLDASTGLYNLPSGRVVQSIQNTFTSSASTTSNSLVTTGHSASITPTSTSSKILAIVSCAVNNTNGNDSGLTLYRGSTNLAGGSSAFVSFMSISGGETGVPATFSYLDTPAVTTALTYTVYYASGGGTTRYNYPLGNIGLGQTASIILLEIL